MLKFWIDYDDPSTGTITPTIDDIGAATSQASATAQEVIFTAGQALVEAFRSPAGLSG